MSNNCFEKINIRLSDTNKLYEDYLKFDYQHTEVPDKLYPSNRTFKRCIVDNSYFENEPIKELMVKYNLVAKIFLVEAGKFYNWHRDAWRYTAFNMLLSGDDDYLTIFSHETPPTDKLQLSWFIYKPLTRLVYEPGYFYLLNSQIPHMVINYGKTDRYLLTIATNEVKVLNAWYGDSADYSKYNTLIEELKQLNLI